MSRKVTREGGSLIRQSLNEHTRAAYREAILAGARRLLLEMRVGDARMADIARETGVSVGTIYNYFDSKDAVFRALLEAEEARLYDLLGTPRQGGTALEHLRATVGRLFDEVAEAAPLMLSYLQTDSTRYSDEARLRAGRGRFFELFEGLVREAQAEGALRQDLEAEVVAGALAGIIHEAIVRVSLDPATDARVLGGQLFTIFYEGARSE